MKPNAQKQYKEPSREFEDSLVYGGCTVNTCGFCGRVHFATDGFYEAGEYDELKRKQAENPDRYIEQDCGSVAVGELDNQTVVFGCPCNRARAYEDFIWSHRGVILKYLQKRIEAEQEIADANSKLLTSLTVLGGL